MTCLWYNNRGDFPPKTQTTLLVTVPRAISTIAEKEQRSMFQYSYNPRLSQHPNVRNFTMFGGAS